MKSSFTFILALLALVANAQNIPNAGFENWISNTWTYMPVGWETENSQLLEPVTQDLDAYEGEFAMRVTSQPTGIGEFAMATTTFDIDYIPASLDFYVKTEVEFGAVSVSIFFYNQENLVASHDWFSSETYEEWTPISIEMVQIEPIITHAKIHVLTEVGDLVAGNAIISVDAMGFASINGMNDVTKGKLSIYPNPTQQVLNVDNPEGNIDHIAIYDLSGKVVKEASISGLSNQIDLAGLPIGSYAVIATLDSGARLSQKLLVSP